MTNNNFFDSILWGEKAKSYYYCNHYLSNIVKTLQNVHVSVQKIKKILCLFLGLVATTTTETWKKKRKYTRTHKKG